MTTKYKLPPAVKKVKAGIVGEPKKYSNLVKVEYSKKPKGKYQLLQDYVVTSRAFGAARITGGSFYDDKNIREKNKTVRLAAKKKYCEFYNIDSDQVIAKPIKGTKRYVKLIRRFDDDGMQIHYRDSKGRFIKYSEVI